MRIMSAGWRMKYITGSRSRTCIFCSIGRSRADRKNLVVLRGKRAFVVMNRYPYSTGHLMVAPYRHVGLLSRLDQAEAGEIMDLVGFCESVLQAALDPQGLNVGVNVGRCAGAGCPGHVHFHVVPRWEGDANFMPVVSETRVLPETLTDTYRKILRAARAFGNGGAARACAGASRAGGARRGAGRSTAGRARRRRRAAGWARGRRR